jgi:glycosyltransferase involved in cell wall biosynthesis
MFPHLPDANGIPRVYDSHNCEALVKAPLLSGTLAGKYLSRRVRLTERQAVTQSDLILACSPEDAATYQEIYRAEARKIVDVPNGVDCRRIQPADDARRAHEKSELGYAALPLGVFIGSNYPPNLEAARLIIESIAPEFPDNQFAIVGGVGPAYLESADSEAVPPNVIIEGFVDGDRLTAIYAAADFALNPMSHGSGTNIKMLDYMAAGLPIVTTPTGARGLQGKPGEHWVESSPENFPVALREILASHDRARDLGICARQLAESTYDWSLLGGRLGEVLVALVEDSRSARAR